MASAPLIAIAVVAIGVLAWLIGAPLWPARRRAAVMAQPLPTTTLSVNDRNVPAVRHLPPELRARLESLMAAFLAEKEFIGCNGLVVTDEMRATIAATACPLVLGRRGHYDELHSVLVYPTAFWVEDEVEDESGVVEKRRRVLTGEAWEASRIILSWDSRPPSSSRGARRSCPARGRPRTSPAPCGWTSSSRRPRRDACSAPA